MKIKLITSYKPGTWNEFAKRGIDSMAENFPSDVDICLYCEETKPTNVHKRVNCIDLNTAEPELFNFKNKYKMILLLMARLEISKAGCVDQLNLKD